MGIIGRLEYGKNLERTIADMYVNEVAYINPAELFFDKSEVPYLNLCGIIYKKQQKNEELIKIIRTGDGRSDYDIDIRNVKCSWIKRGFDIEDDFNDPEIIRLSYNPLPERNTIEFKEQISLASDKYLLLQKYTQDLDKAINNSEFERAAKLRDKIAEINTHLKNNSE